MHWFDPSYLLETIYMKFIEDIHKYIDGDKEYMPVTYFIKTFEPYKDWDKIAAAYAKKHNRTKEDVKAEWEANKNKAAVKGTKYHAQQEQALLNDGRTYVNNTLCEVANVVMIGGVKEETTLALENNKVYPEKMIWSKKYGICGQADLVQVVDNKIYIKDYKTNKKLDFESFNHPRTGKEKLKSPLTHLDCCNFNIYQLQLNLYMYMLLQQNRHLKIGDMTIIHVIFENDVVMGTRDVPVQNMQKEVKAMLEYHLNKKK